jgi:glutathione S-transferase
MPRTLKLYQFTGSMPSRTARLMLEHKGLDYKPVHLMVGPHAFGMLGRGYQTMTVPAMKIDGQRVQGSREISRALDGLVPAQPLFPADPERRHAVVRAERWGEQLQDAVRRVVLCASRRDAQAFLDVYRHASPLRRPAQRLSRRPVIRLATAGHRATDVAGEEDLAELPARLDQIDRWISDGVLNGPELNAADFQIAPNVALLLRFAQLAPFIEDRPAASHARRVAPDDGPAISAVLPQAWLATLSEAPDDGRAGSPSLRSAPLLDRRDRERRDPFESPDEAHPLAR